jgi:pullulanase
MKDFPDKILQNNIVHNQSNLHDYDLFSSGKYVKHAFLFAPGKILIIPATPDLNIELSELQIAEIDYLNHESGTYAFKAMRKAVVHNDENIIVEIDHYTDDKNYVIIYGDEQIYVFLDPAVGGIIDTYYDASGEGPFGVSFTGKKAQFRLWSPPAARVELLLYHADGSPLSETETVVMKKGKRGVWSALIIFDDAAKDDILLYQYRVYAYGKSYLALDPYAVSMGLFNPGGDDKIGKGAIVRMDSAKALPEGFTRTFRNHKIMSDPCDLIAYEMHVRDFTSQPGVVNPEYAGTYRGFAQKAIYLKELGITHVQLMPVMKFYTVDEASRSFSGRDAGQINYNWGYDPLSYFSPEGWFSTDPANPCARISELRSLVQELHNHQMGVIFDVVYNHTHIVETFEHVAPGCYYRFTEDLKISGHTGAGPSLESRRPMVRKLIIDSILHLIREYHADGFRFDLMGFLDHETMLMIRDVAGKAYDPEHPDSLILQGEAWVFSDLNTDVAAQGSDAAVTKLNFPHQLEFLGIFNDTARDAIVGNPGSPGFVAGGREKAPLAATAVVGAVKGTHPGPVPFNRAEFFQPYHLFALSPSNCLNFISIHDGLPLADKFRLMMPGAAENEITLSMRLATLMLFTSAGKIILHGGDEILRSKPLAGSDQNSERALTASGVKPVEGAVHFHENSYASPDFTNMIRWDILSGDNSSHALPMLEYFRGLIRMRRSLPALRNMEKGADRIRFLTASSHIRNEVPCIFLSFTDPSLHSMTVEFINGPSNERYYVAGEVHSPGVSHNPENNPYYLDFDETGKAVICFDRNHIQRFDTGKWGNSRTLEIKLVRQCGSWETMKGAYSETGNNSIDAAMLDETGHVVIDLGQQDFAAVPGMYEYDPFLAYLVENDPGAYNSLRL